MRKQLPEALRDKTEWDTDVEKYNIPDGYEVLAVNNTTYHDGKPAQMVKVVCPKCKKYTLITDIHCLHPRYDLGCISCE